MWLGSVKSMIFGGEGVFFAHLKGPGTVWIQSLPFSRLAGRILAGARGGKDEGSILGSLFGPKGGAAGNPAAAAASARGLRPRERASDR